MTNISRNLIRRALSGKRSSDLTQNTSPYTPNTDQEETDSYVLALRTDDAHHKAMTALRNQYFPPKLNQLSAHVTLFHALPGTQLPTIESDITDLCSRHPPFTIKAVQPFRMRTGVGITVAAQPARKIHNALKEKWKDFLSQQDHNFKPHYTIQNKVQPKIAEETMEDMWWGFKELEGQVDGLVLWRYDRGFWRDARDFRFEGKKQG